MAPSRIMIIRHGEAHGEPGVSPPDRPDEHSLEVRGWQRAGALARFFRPKDGPSSLTPSTIFASKIAGGSETKRPQQTVAPLAALLGLTVQSDHAKTEAEALMQQVSRCDGIVLVAWEHSVIPKLVAALRETPRDVPAEWPKHRYDLVWLLDRAEGGWRFTAIEQDVLS